MVEKFLLHFFSMSAHAYTRGSFTTPKSANVADREVPAGAYAAAGPSRPVAFSWFRARIPPCYPDRVEAGPDFVPG